MRLLPPPPFHLPTLCGLLLGFLGPATSGLRAQYYWDGGSLFNKRWTTENNWTNNTTPPLNSGAAIVFDTAGTGEPTSILDATYTLSSLDFVGTANWVIEPQNGAILNIGSGGIRQAAASYTTRINTPINVTATSTWDIDFGAITIEQPVTVPTAGHTLTINADNLMSANLLGGGVGSSPGRNIFGIALSGPGNLVKTGLGTLLLGGELELTGSIAVNQGLLQFTQFDGGEWLTGGEILHPAISSDTKKSIYIASGATLDLNSNVAHLSSLTGSGLMAVRKGYLKLNTTSANTFTGDFQLELTTETPPNGSNYTGRGRIIMDGYSTFTWAPAFSAWSIDGDVEVTDGTFRLSGGSGLSSLSKLIMTAGTFDFNGVSDSIATIEGSGTITLGGANLTIGSTNENITYPGVISGTGSLTKIGSGTLFLQGANSYVGNTLINGGVLELGASNRIPDNSTVDIAGLFRLGPVSGSTGYSETVGAISGGGTINLKSGSLLAGANNTSTTFSGTISGAAGSFSKVGTGTLTLTGLNTYTGGTGVSTGGTLLGNPSRSFPGPLANEGTVIFSPIVSNSVLYPSGSVPNMSGAGTFRVASGFSLTVSNATNTGPLEIESGGSVTASANGLSDNGRVNLMTGGTLTYGANASDQIGSLIGGGNVTMAGGTLSVGSDNSSHTFSGGFPGPGSFAKTGTGTMTLSGTGLFNPNSITVSGGGLSLRAGVVTGAIPIVNNAHLIFSWSSTATAAVSVTGSGTVEKINSGQLDLTGSIASTGLFTVNGGTVRVGDGLDGAGNNHIGNTTPILVGSSSTVRFLNSSETVGPLSGNGSVVLSATTLNLNTADYTASTFGGSLSGTGTLQVNGLGSLILTGNNSFFTTFGHGYGVIVNGGDLQVSSDSNLGGADTGGIRSNVQILNGATLRLGSGFTSARTLSFTSGASWIDTGATNAAWTGPINGAGGLRKLGTGTLTLSGPSSRSGGTNVESGTLSLGAAQILSDGESVTLQPGTSLLLNGNTETIGNLTGWGTVQLGGGSLTVVPSSDVVFNGFITGPGTVNKSGAKLTLSQVQTWSGPLNVSGGTLAISASERLPNSLTLSLASPATLELGGFNETVGTVSGTGKISLGGGTFGFGAGNGSFDFETSLVLPGSDSGILRKTGSGTVVLKTAWTSPAVSLAVEGGTLVQGSAGRIGNSSPVSVSAGAVLNTGGFSEAIGPLSGSGLVSLGTGSLTVSVSASQGTPVFSGSISGGTSLAKTGDGVWTLAGVSGHSGATTVSGGTLRLGADGALPSATALSLSSGTILDLNGRLLFTGSVSGAGEVRLGSGGLFFTGGDNSSTNYSGAITGTGSFVKNGSGTLTLSGTQTYTGGLQVSGGTIAFTSEANLGTGNIGLDGGTLRWLSGASADLSPRLLSLGFGGGSFDLESGVFVSFAQPISGGGTMRKKGSGTLVFSAGNSFSGSTVVEGGKLLVNGACGASPVEVMPGATLGGFGTVGNLASTGTVSPGNSFGTLTVSGNAALTGGALYIEISGLVNSLLDVTGNLDLSNVALSVSTAAPAAAQPSSRVIATYGGTLNGVFSSVPDGYYVRYNQGTLANQIVLERTAAASLDDWAVLFGLNPLTDGDPLADPDGDGVPNILEFTLGGIPSFPDRHLLPSPVHSEGSVTYTFSRNDLMELNGAGITLETGSDIANLSESVVIGPVNTANVSVLENGSAPDTITVTFPLAPGGRRFFRLRVDVAD